MLLGSKMPAELDLFRTLKMLLVHDLVEVYAGDTRVYDTLVRKIDDGELMYDATKIANKMEREELAASKLFSILPEDLHDDFQGLFTEFEQVRTLEAKIAKVLDKIHPLLQSSVTDGKDYKECQSTYRGEMQLVKKHIDRLPEECQPIFVSMVTQLLDDAQKRGWLVNEESKGVVVA